MHAYQNKKCLFFVDAFLGRRSLSKGMIHMVSPWAAKNELILGQIKTKEKSNEITAIPELLNLLAIEGCIIKIDAMGCQKK